MKGVFQCSYFIIKWKHTECKNKNPFLLKGKPKTPIKQIGTWLKGQWSLSIRFWIKAECLGLVVTQMELRLPLEISHYQSTSSLVRENRWGWQGVNMILLHCINRYGKVFFCLKDRKEEEGTFCDTSGYTMKLLIEFFILTLMKTDKATKK